MHSKQVLSLTSLVPLEEKETVRNPCTSIVCSPVKPRTSLKVFCASREKKSMEQLQQCSSPVGGTDISKAQKLEVADAVTD